MDWTVKNNVAPSGQRDPRIDSPQIKVVYPTKELPLETEQPLATPLTQPQALIQANEATTASTQVKEHSEPHVCKLSFQDAIKAHSTAFILVGLGLLALGFIIGKNKV